MFLVLARFLVKDRFIKKAPYSIKCVIRNNTFRIMIIFWLLNVIINN